MNIRSRAKKSFLRIVRLQSKEYQKLFTPTCKKNNAGIPPNLIQSKRSQVRTQEGNREKAPFQGGVAQGAQSSQSGWATPQDGSKVDPTQLSARRGPPTDRPPDKPPPCKGASRGCLQERAGTRHASHLASFTRGSYGLSGNATPLQKMQFEVCAPSIYSASYAAGSPQCSSTRLRDNNTFAWSGPSGVPGCTGQRLRGPLYGVVHASPVASRAGGLRCVVGSGPTGYVCDKWSPSSKPGP
jgi:hypothetical protein